MALITSKDYQLTPDLSPLAQALSQAIIQSGKYQQEDRLLKQQAQAEQADRDLETMGAQFLNLRGKDFTTQKKELAIMGQNAIKEGKDASVYTEAMNINNPDEMNLYLTRNALKASEARKAILGALKPTKTEGTANIQDYEYYQKLKKVDPEGAKQFGQDVGLVSKEGRELSAFYQKALDESTTAAIKSGNNVSKYTTLASELDKANIQGGKGTRVSEYMKNLTGNQDEVTNLRREFFGIRSSQAVNNLPPGVASDKDIELALKGFPPDDASGAYMASFLRGMSKLEKFNEEFNTFKADYISQYGSLRDPKGGNMLQAWKKHIKENPIDVGIDYGVTKEERAAQTTAQPPAVNDQGWKLHEDANGNKAYVGPNGEIEEL